MNWTCCECENKYDNSTGDVDERMCNDCLDGDEYVEPFETNLIKLRVSRDNYSHHDKNQELSELIQELHPQPIAEVEEAEHQ